MSNPADVPEQHPNTLPQQGDEWLRIVLGGTLQGATIRSFLILAAVGVVLATIAALVR